MIYGNEKLTGGGRGNARGAAIEDAPKPGKIAALFAAATATLRSFSPDASSWEKDWYGT
jgi:hypothetical protein